MHFLLINPVVRSVKVLLLDKKKQILGGTKDLDFGQVFRFSIMIFKLGLKF